jgi:hypothetical protein
MNLIFTRKMVLLLGLFLATAYSVVPTNVAAVTVLEVARDLACPCECPLVLEDCNMTCGLEWKEEIGQLIKEGMSKQQIIDHFIADYGEEARLTPRQKIDGKIHQYTRNFDTVDWVLLWSGVGGWAVLMFFGVYIGIRKLFSGRMQTVA